MRSRGLVVVLALILATVATVGVFLYSRGVKEDAESGGNLSTVIVSKVDIPANTDLNTLISQDQFVTTQVREENLVQDAITSISQLRNRRNSVFILAGEQIPVSRVQGGKVVGGVLSIPEGHQAITVALGVPRAVGSALSGGDNVTVYATFTDVTLEPTKKELRAQQQQANATGQQQQAPKPVAVTTVLVPQVEVLRVYIPQRSTVTTGGDSTNQQDLSGDINVTLAFLPEEAQRFVFALEQGSVYLSLLPPDAQGTELEPLTVDAIVNPPKVKGQQ